MGDGFRETVVVAASGTKSGWMRRAGYTLVGLILPTLDSTTITFEVSPDATDTNASEVHSNSGTTAVATLGHANTGDVTQAVPEEIGRLAAVVPMRIVVAAQSEQRTITAIFQRR